MQGLPHGVSLDAADAEPLYVRLADAGAEGEAVTEGDPEGDAGSDNDARARVDTLGQGDSEGVVLGDALELPHGELDSDACVDTDAAEALPALVGEVDALRHSDEDALADAPPEGERSCDCVTAVEADDEAASDGVAESCGEALAVTASDGDRPADTLPSSDGVCESDADGVGVCVAHPDSVADVAALALPVRVCDALPQPVRDADALPLKVEDGVRGGDCVASDEVDDEAASDGVAEICGEALAVTATDSDRPADTLPGSDGECESDADCVGVSVTHTDPAADVVTLAQPECVRDSDALPLVHMVALYDAPPESVCSGVCVVDTETTSEGGIDVVALAHIVSLGDGNAERDEVASEDAEGAPGVALSAGETDATQDSVGAIVAVGDAVATIVSVTLADGSAVSTVADGDPLEDGNALGDADVGGVTDTPVAYAVAVAAPVMTVGVGAIVADTLAEPVAESHADAPREADALNTAVGVGAIVAVTLAEPVADSHADAPGEVDSLIAAVGVGAIVADTLAEPVADTHADAPGEVDALSDPVFDGDADGLTLSDGE